MPKKVCGVSKFDVKGQVRFNGLEIITQNKYCVDLDVYCYKKVTKRSL